MSLRNTVWDLTHICIFDIFVRFSVTWYTFNGLWQVSLRYSVWLIRASAVWLLPIHYVSNGSNILSIDFRSVMGNLLILIIKYYMFNVLCSILYQYWGSVAVQLMSIHPNIHVEHVVHCISCKILFVSMCVIIKNHRTNKWYCQWTTVNTSHAMPRHTKSSEI